MLDPMRFAALCLSLVGCSLTSCAEMTVGDIRVHGWAGKVTLEDIHDAIAADQALPHQEGKKIYDIQIISSAEIRFYHRPIPESAGWDTVQRVKGKWRWTGGAIITG